MKNKDNIIIVIGMFLVFIGSFLPSIKIATENISFIKENGYLIIILVAAMGILFKLNYKQLLYIPSILSVIIILKFIIDNKERLNQITEIYNCYASYRYGIIVMLLGNIIILSIATLKLFNIDINFEVLKEKMIKRQENMEIKHETTKDGKIKFNKITIKCDNEEFKKNNQKNTIKEKLEKLKLKIQTNKFKKRKLSISKFDENREIKTSIPTIDIKKWTANKIYCSNCGATVYTTSEYCFLCDCKIKLNHEKEKLS